MYQVQSRAKASRNLATITLVAVAAYSACFFIFGAPFVPPTGTLFSLVLVLVLGHIGGFLAVQVRGAAQRCLRTGDVAIVHYLLHLCIYFVFNVGAVG